MRTRISLFMAVALAAVLFTSCHKHEDNESIEIRFVEPKNGEKVANAAEVHIHIEVEASDENHQIKIELHPENDSSEKIINLDKHAHDKVYKFEQDVDLSSYPAGTEFHLEVEACLDHDCKQKERKHIDFSI